jgi:hypothetical protein
MVVPLPNAGGPLPLFVNTRDGVQLSSEWFMLRRQLASVPDLKLVVLDPLGTFAQVDLDADNCGVGFVMGKLGSLAAELGATVAATHHMRKQAGSAHTPAEARERIRGASNLVDGGRATYALWAPDDAEAKRVCRIMSIPFSPGRVVSGGLVKTNGKANLSVATYIRTDDGLLLDRSNDLSALRPPRATLRTDLIATIGLHAESGHPFTVTGADGLYEKRDRLPRSLNAMKRDPLRALANELLTEGAIVRCKASGSHSDKWLDVPDGPFARGEGVFVVGAP